MENAEELENKSHLGNVHELEGHICLEDGQYQLAIESYNKQLVLAEEDGNKRGVRKAHVNLGKVYLRAGQYQKCIECLLLQLEIAEDLEDKEDEARAHMLLRNTLKHIGFAIAPTGQYELAIESCNKRLRFAEEQGSKKAIGKARAKLGIVYRMAGQYQKSIECLLVQLEIAEDLEDKEEEARAHMNLGDTCQDMGQYEGSYECHTSQLMILEQLGKKQDVANAYGDLGNTFKNNAEYEKAIDCYEKQLKIFEEMGNKEHIANAYDKIGFACIHNAQYQEAINYLEKELQIHEEMGDNIVIARTYAKLGIAYDRIGQCQKAIDWHRKFLEIAEKVKDTLAIGTAYGLMAESYAKLGEHYAAIDYHRKHLEISESLGNKYSAAIAYKDIGASYISTGQYQKAMDCLRKSLEIAQESGNKLEGMKCIIYSYLAVCYYCTGEYQKAVDYKLKSLEIAKAMNDRQLLLSAYEDMGSCYSQIYRYQKAIECERKFLELAQELGDEDKRRMAISNLASYYIEIGQYSGATDCIRNYLDSFNELGNNSDDGKKYVCMGSACIFLGQYQKALDCFRKSLKIAEELGEKDLAQNAHICMGHAYLKIGEFLLTVVHVQKSLDLANETGIKSYVGTGYRHMGQVYRYIGQRDKAIDSYQRSLESAQETGDDFSVAAAQMLLGVCYQGNDDHLACSYFAKSILSCQKTHSSLTCKDEFNTSFSNTYAVTYKFLLQSLLNLNQVKSALLVSDSGKAKALYDLTRRTADVVLDSVQEKKIISPVQPIAHDPPWKASEALFDVVLSKVINQMQDGSIISYTFSADGRLHAWVISRGGVFYRQWQPMNGMSAKTYLTIVGDFLLDILSAKPKANRQNVILYSDDQITSSVANERESTHLRSTFSKDLKKRMQSLIRNGAVRKKRKRDEHATEYDCVKKRYNLDQPTSNHHAFGKRNDDDEDEEKLFGRYFLDTPKVIPRNKLHPRENKTQQDTTTETYRKKLYSILISPIEEYLVGSKLLVVPESSLFRVPFCALLNSKDEHLCDRFSLQFTPSLHVLDSCLSRPLPKLGPALFVGNPTVGEVKFGDKVGSIPSLPNATVETRECGKYFNAELLLEQSATKQKVLKKLKDASVIHIAAHGHMDHADIFLAPNDGAPKPPSEEHYLLTAKDIVDCTLKARLVLLSCCHSGRGQISAEGVVGIARSFLGAGARSVLVTLWQIPDKPTMKFMMLFYERVCQGLSVCVALQQAMLELRKKYHAMKAWAPFQIVGEDVVLTPNDIEEIRRQSRVG